MFPGTIFLCLLSSSFLLLGGLFPPPTLAKELGLALARFLSVGGWDGRWPAFPGWSAVPSATPGGWHVAAWCIFLAYRQRAVNRAKSALAASCPPQRRPLATGMLVAGFRAAKACGGAFAARFDRHPGGQPPLPPCPKHSVFLHSSSRLVAVKANGSTATWIKSPPQVGFSGGAKTLGDEVAGSKRCIWLSVYSRLASAGSDTNFLCSVRKMGVWDTGFCRCCKPHVPRFRSIVTAGADGGAFSGASVISPS